MRGLFITFEGGEGSGKTTIISTLEETLKNKGYDVVRSREPGGSRIAEAIRNVILDVQNTEMDYMTEALLYAASRRQHLVEVIKPALADNKVVLCDRFIDSSLAYQGYARGLGIDEVFALNQYATEGLLPDLTIYIELEAEIGLKRIKNNHRNEDRLDLEKLSFHDLVHQGYLELVKRYPDRVKKVDGSLSVSEVYSQIEKIVSVYLKGDK